VALLMLLIGNFLTLNLLYIPAKGQLTNVVTEVEVLRSQVFQLTNVRNELERMKQYKKQIDEEYERLTVGKNGVDVINIIIGIIDDSGVSIIAENYGDIKLDGELSYQAIELKVGGSYKSIKELVYKLDDSEFFVDMKSLEISSSSKKVLEAKLNFDVVKSLENES